MDSSNPSPSIAHSFWISSKGFIAGTFCGICETIVGHPLDTLKTRIQCVSPPPLAVIPGNATTTSNIYNSKPSFISTGINIIRLDGFTALYRGFSARVTACAIANGFLFGSNGEFKRLLKYDPERHSPLNYRFVLAGALTGVLESTVNTPVDSVKVKAQVQTSSIKNGGKVTIKKPSEIMMENFRNGGIRGLYRGYAVTMARDSLANGVYFTTYELCKRFLGQLEQEYRYNELSSERNEGKSEKYTPSQMVILFSGGIAGTACWAVSYPLDTVKSIVQAQINIERGGNKNFISQKENLVRNDRSPGSLKITDIKANENNNRSLHVKVNTIKDNKSCGTQRITLGETKISHNYRQSQMLSYKGNTAIYNSATDSSFSLMNGPGINAARKLFAEEGVAGFFRGVTPCLLRAFPTCATAFFSYEYAMAFLDQL